MDKKIFERCVNRFCFYFNTSHATFINWKCTTTNATNYTNRYTWNCGFFSCFLIQGATEEIVVRGWLFPVLSVRSRIWVGIVVTSFIWFSSFTKSRYYNPFNIEYNISWCVCSFYVLKDSSLWGICAWHSIWNWAQYNVFGFAVSGMEMYSTPILDL